MTLAVWATTNAYYRPIIEQTTVTRRRLLHVVFSDREKRDE